MWFEKLTGIKEENLENIKDNIVILDGGFMHSKANGRLMKHGKFLELPLCTLKERMEQKIKEFYPIGFVREQKLITFTKIKGDIKTILEDDYNTNALFQVASQFNYLEMIDNDITKEDGIDIYEDDNTQAPKTSKLN